MLGLVKRRVQVQGWPHGELEDSLRRVAKLPKQFKPLKAYEAERRRGLMHTPEHEERMRLLKDEFQRWLLAE